LNKIDLLEDKTWLDHLHADFPHAVAICAKLKLNFDQLLKEIQANFQPQMVVLDLEIPHGRMDLVNLFYKQGQVQEVDYQQKHIKVKVSLPRILALKIQQELA
jgi:50S ribosomal subunit-associated GTPase HflX